MGILMQFQNDPAGTLILLLYRAPAILIALTLHELAHGYVALKCGDPTAQMLGRLTFNPLKHLDPVGTVFMFLFGFGWARPVPVNPRNYKRFRRDDILVSLAGVAMNLLLFLTATLLSAAILRLAFVPEMWQQGELVNYHDFLRFDGWNFYSVLSGENALYRNYTDVWIVTMRESAGVLPALTDYMKAPWILYLLRFLTFFVQINLSLAIFNLLPIPPLDGYHVVNDIFLRGKLHIPAKAINLAMMVLLFLFMFTNIFSKAISKAVYFVQGGVVNGLLAIFGLR